MKSLKEEAAAKRVEPEIEAHLLLCRIDTERGRLESAQAIAGWMKEGWTVMFANLDNHSTTMVYTLSRATVPGAPKPDGIAVR